MTDTAVVLDQKISKKVKEPDRFRVIIFDDSDTPFDWVVAVLVRVFNYTKDRAIELSRMIDAEGMGVAGTYSYEIAEQKTSDAISLSRTNGYPLDLKIEKD